MEDNTPYTKRELDEHFRDVKEHIDDVKQLAKAIDTKVGIQNGRVTANEAKWKAINVSFITATVFISVILSLVVYSFKVSMENQKNSILLEVKDLYNESKI